MRPARKVWITGVGAVTPLGNGWDAIAANLLAGRSGVRRVTRFDVAQHPCQIAGLIEQIPCPPGFDAADFANLSRLDQLLLSCCGAALDDAGLWTRRQALRIGLVLGIGAEWLIRWESDALRGGANITEPHRDSATSLGALQRRLELRGPAVCVAAACATGNYALAQARRWLEMDWVDVCVAGAGDLGITPMGLAGFGNLRALSRRNDQPEAASRPFDRQRDGFVAAEGGAVFVLEPADAARQRGAHAYAEVAGFGASSDAHHMVIPCPDPEPGAAAVRRALADARINPDQLDYINAHATSTPVGDVAEARILHTALGAAARTVPVSSSKSMTGHLLTAAAAFEALVCLIALRNQTVPPTINLEEPDPDCNLCHIANAAQDRPVRVAMSNSFGFGGSNTCLVLRAAA
jgi:3-oxoacyl-[acyl-carrier-protein] synthase II